MRERKGASRHKLTPESLESRTMMSAAPNVHDGGGTQVLTSVQSGQTYNNYRISAGLQVGGTTGVTINSCSVTGAGNGILVSGTATNLSITNCTFADTGKSTGIYSNGQGTFINCHFDDNTFNGVYEDIHVDFGASGNSNGCSASNNQCLDFTRWGIELQGISASGLKVDNNYFLTMPGVKNGGGAISCATGDALSHYNGFTRGNEIAYNVILGAAGNINCGAIENYGSATSIHDNYIEGPWTWAVNWDATGLAGNVPWYIQNNVFIGCGSIASTEGFGTAAQNIAPTLANNQVYALGAANTPAVPTWSANGSATSTPTPTRTATAPAVATFSATASSNGVDLALPGTAGTLTWTATGNSGSPLTSPTSNQTNSITIAAGTTSYVDASVPDSLQVYYTYSGAIGQTVRVTAMPNQDSGQSPVQPPAPLSAPIVAPVVPAPATTVTPILVGYIPTSWTAKPTQAITNFDGPLP